MSSALIFVISAMMLFMMTSQSMSASLNGGEKPSASALQSTQLRDVIGMDDAHLLKRSLRDELAHHFEMLQEAEEDLLQRIETLKARRQAVSQRKRSHYMCMVNIVACYK